MRKCEDKEQRRSAVLARNKAQSALWEHEQDARDQFSSLHLFVHYWAQGKQENRRAWAQAMNTIVSNGTGSGAVLFQSFPQEVVDAFAEATGGQRVRVRLPKTVLCMPSLRLVLLTPGGSAPPKPAWAGLGPPMIRSMYPRRQTIDGLR